MDMDTGNGSLRVLIVDDCPDTVRSMQTLCKLTGFDSLGVSDGMAAIELAKHYRPNIVLLDISLPYVDGYDVAEGIREQDDGRQIVIVAMTGHIEESYKERAVA